MILRGLCRVRPLCDTYWLLGSGDAQAPRYVSVSAWCDDRPVTIVVYWLNREDLPCIDGERQSLLPLVQYAAARQDPELTELPDHDHDDVFCFRWAGHFIFTPHYALTDSISGALEDEAWLAEKAAAAE